MIELFYSQLFFLLPAAFFAGLVDSMVGGGGLIQVPALFSAFPNTAPATLFGTNKLSSLGGSLMAASRYLRVVRLPKKEFLIASIFALAGSFLGAFALSFVPATYIRVLLPFLLIALLAFTLAKKDMGLVHDPKLGNLRATLFLTLGVGAIGFYDGFFGPGTGSFFMFLFVHYLGFDFLHGAAATKIVNSVTNFAALLWFIPTGHINWTLAFLMFGFNVLGGLVGSNFAMKKGSQLIRKVFIGLVLVLVIKTANDAFHLF